MSGATVTSLEKTQLLLEKQAENVDQPESGITALYAVGTSLFFYPEGGSATEIGGAASLNDSTAADVDVANDSFAFIDASDSNGTKKESIADLMTAVAGDGLAASSGVLAVGVDDSSIELNSDALRVKASGITNAMLAGSIADSKLS